MVLPLTGSGLPATEAGTGVENPGIYLSGGVSNTDPNASIGDAVSSSSVDTSFVNQLFDDVSEAECIAGDTEYRCVYVQNDGNGSWTTPSVWISSTTPSTDTAVAIGLDPAGKNGTAATPANESTAPAAVTFSSPTTKVGGLTLATLAPGDYQAFWIRRTISASAAEYLEDQVTISIED